ncbi:MAG: hypothetical protein JXA95_13660 [Spirochaetales bacterium]|nr:hypothetical protein [Spirochaetales bacterium]
MEDNIIYFDIIENPLKGSMKYRGIIHHPESVNNRDLIDEIVGSNTTITRQDAMGVIDLYEQLIRKHLKKGHTVTTGLFRADISLTGSFDHPEEKIDYGKHRAKVVIRPAKKLSQSICFNLRFHRDRESRNNHFFSLIHSPGTDLPEKTARAGGVLCLRGKGLKSYRHDNSYDLRLKGEAGESHSLPLFSASYGRIMAQIPPGVPPGIYMLSLVHRYGTVERRFPEFGMTIL